MQGEKNARAQYFGSANAYLIIANNVESNDPIWDSLLLPRQSSSPASLCIFRTVCFRDTFSRHVRSVPRRDVA